MNELTKEEAIKKILDYAQKNYDDQQQSNISLAIDLARKSNNLEPLINKINEEKYENMHFVCNIFLREVYYQSHSVKIEDYSLDYILTHTGMFKLNAKISDEMRKKLESKELSVTDVFTLVHNNEHNDNLNMNRADPYKYVNTSKDFQDYPLFSFMSNANFRKLGKALGGTNLQKAIDKYNEFFKKLEAMDKAGSDVVLRLASYCQGRTGSFEGMLINSIYDKTDIIMRVNEDGSYTEFVPNALNTLNFRIRKEISFPRYVNDWGKFIKQYCESFILLTENQRNFVKNADWQTIETLIENTKGSHNIPNYFSSNEIINLLTPPYESFKYICRMLDLIDKMLFKLEEYTPIDVKNKFMQVFTENYEKTNDFKNSATEAFFSVFDFLKTFTNDYQEFYEKYYGFLYEAEHNLLKMIESNKNNKFAEPIINLYAILAEYNSNIKSAIISKYFKIIDTNDINKLVNPDLGNINMHPDFYENREVVEKLGLENFKKFVAEVGISNSDHDIFRFLRENIRLIDFQSDNYADFKRNLLIFIVKINFTEYRYSNFDYSSFSDSLKKDYPDFFMDESAPNALKYFFYQGKTDPKYIESNPQYYEYFRKLNLKVIFEVTEHYSLAKVLDHISNDKFLPLFYEFGSDLDLLENGSFDYANDDPEKYILNKYKLLLMKNYTLDVNNLDEILQKIPELCPDSNMSDELKYVFIYHKSEDGTLGFQWLKNHPEYKQYPDKYFGFFLPVENKGHLYYNFIEEYGGPKAFEIGLRLSDRIDDYITCYNGPYLFKSWYEKTNGKFVPPYYLARKIPTEYMDKFLCNAKKWHTLLRFTEPDVNVHKVDEYQIADLLTLSIVCGTFDNDEKNFNKLNKLLIEVPKSLDKLPNYPENFTSMLASTLEQEGFKLDKSTNILEQIYRKNPDGTYTLNITHQKYPKSIMILHNLMAERNPNYLTLSRIHSKLGSLSANYNPDFTSFFLNNINEFINPNINIEEANLEDVYFEEREDLDYIAAIQHKFDRIKAFFANVPLTLEKVKTYIFNSETDYTEGNEFFGDTVGKIGYSEEQTKILEQIYNIGKNRIFSSIPRISGKSDDYSYEILRMDNPLGLVIGNLSDCCQQLGGAAETSMEHSMVSNNGRVFVIKDKNNRIIAQSWVWRNRNTICFDNIEIPDRVFKRDDGINYTKVIYNIYLQAAKEFVKIEEETYLDLYQKQLITKEQYDNLRLSKVTVGLGYNDIAEYIEANAKKSQERVSPLKENSPVLNDNYLYIADSKTQYLLSANDEFNPSKQKFSINLPLYSDDFSVKTQLNNVEALHLMTLKKLTVLATEDDDETDIYYDENEEEANEYLNDNTKKLISANFVIVFTDNDTLKIEALYYNPTVDKTTLLLQIYLAIGQIKNNLEIDISNLDEKEQQIIEEALKSEDLIKEKRGITNGK